LKIKEYIRLNIWSDFVKNHPNGNIFQTPEMYDVYLRTENYEPVLLTVVKNDEVVGVLLSVIQKEYSGVLGKITARSIIIGGPLIKDNNPDVLKFLLNAYTQKIKYRVIFSQFRNLWDWGELKPVFNATGFEYDSHLDILIDITLKEEELWSKINSKARNKIRKSMKSDIVFKTPEPTKEIIEKSYEIFHNIYKNAKIPLTDISLFENSVKILAKKNMIRFFCAFKDDQMIGVRIGLLYKDVVYDWYAGSLHEFYKFNPNDFLPYNTLVWGHNNGFKTFDFGGAGKPNVPYGVRDHKMKFGGELVEYGRYEKVHKPKLMSMAKVGLELYKMIR